MNISLEAIFYRDPEYTITFSRIIIMNVNRSILNILYFSPFRSILQNLWFICKIKLHISNPHEKSSPVIYNLHINF